MESTSTHAFRFGVLGYGKIARTRFLPSLNHLASCRLTAIGTRRPHEHDLVSFGSPPPEFLTYGDLVSKGRRLVDGVYIALPNHLHEEWVIRCAEAGLHVLCEKPLVPDSAAALRCRETCRQHGVLLAEAFMYRHAPRYRRARELLQCRLGQVHLLEASFSYLLEDLTNIRLQPDAWGGALMDVGCYGIDLARFLLGDEPVDVTARGIRGKRSRVDELIGVPLVFASGALAMISASTHLARFNACRVRGSLGTLTIPNAFIPPEDQPTRILLETPDGETKEHFEPFAPYQAQISHFIKAVQNKETHISPPAEDGVANARVMESVIGAMGDCRLVDLFGGSA